MRRSCADLAPYRGRAQGWNVYSVEIVPQLKERATGWLTDTGYMQTGRLHTRLGDGYLGWPGAAPFDGIIVTCSPSHIPQPLKDQLAIGGKLLVPVGPDLALSRMLLITRTGPTTYDEEFLCVFLRTSIEF
jgi:protein-L-isoaspartate(D-aspartate) O-methyltransferase